MKLPDTPASMAYLHLLMALATPERLARAEERARQSAAEEAPQERIAQRRHRVRRNNVP